MHDPYNCVANEADGSLQAACDFVCAHLSPSLFDLALDIVFREVSTTARSNSARAVSQVVSCFARANSSKTLKKYFLACDTHIRTELEGGASSTRTTSSNTPIESDVTLHWWIGILTGTITNGGAEVRVFLGRVCHTPFDAVVRSYCATKTSSRHS